MKISTANDNAATCQMMIKGCSFAVMLLCFLIFALGCQPQAGKSTGSLYNEEFHGNYQINTATNWFPTTDALDDSAQDDTNCFGLDRDVEHFYDLLRKKDWKGAYQLRWKSFKRDLPEETYLDWAKQDGARWELLNYEVLMVYHYGPNDVTLICKFIESVPGLRVSYVTVEWHKEEDGVWRCNGAGPTELPIFVALTPIQPPVDN